MKLFLRLILIGTLTYFLSLIFPWWIIACIGAVCGWLIPGGVISTFISGFLGVGIVWMGHAWSLDAKNESVFTNTMLEVLPFGEPIVLIVVTGAIGGLVGGLAAVSGGLLRKPAEKKRGGGYYQ